MEQLSITRSLTICVPYPKYQRGFTLHQRKTSDTSPPTKKFPQTFEDRAVVAAPYMTKKALSDFFDMEKFTEFKESIAGCDWLTFVNIVVSPHFRKFEIWPDMLRVTLVLNLELASWYAEEAKGVVNMVRDAIASRFQTMWAAKGAVKAFCSCDPDIMSDPGGVNFSIMEGTYYTA